jgi:SHS2 domain-containing protein
MEHTADVGLIVHGVSLPALFANAAEGMFALMAELAGVQEREERTIEVEGSDWGGLLVSWLSELLFFLDSQEMLFRRFEIRELVPYRLRVTAFGEPINRDRHMLHFAVKAVTKHMLEVRQEDGHWRAQILFDI